MEILHSAPIDVMPVWVFIGLLVAIFIGGIGAIFATENCYKTGITMIILGIIAVCIFANITEPSETKFRYTVEITDELKYKELVDKNYKFIEKSFENKDIYIIEGDKFE